jgi:integrase
MKGFKKVRRGVWFDGRRTAILEVSIPGSRGRRRKRKTVAVSNRAEVEAAYAAFRHEVLVGPIRPTTVPTFAEYVAGHWPIGEVSRATATNETSALRVNLIPFFGSLRLDQITGATVRDFRSSLGRDGYANPSINGRLRLLRKIFGDAVRRDILTALPRQWPRPLPEPEIHNEATDVERTAFLNAFENRPAYVRLLASEAPRQGFRGVNSERAANYLYGLFRAARPVFVVAFETGLSRSDLLGLEWEHIDFENGLIRTPRKKTGVWSIIPISDICRAALSEARNRSTVSCRYVFTVEGRPYSVSTVTRYFERAKKIAGMDRPFRFHDVRHSFGSALARRGVPALIIKEAMGHANLRTTERYARVDEAALKRFVLPALNAARN